MPHLAATYLQVATSISRSLSNRTEHVKSGDRGDRHSNAERYVDAAFTPEKSIPPRLWLVAASPQIQVWHAGFGDERLGKDSFKLEVPGHGLHSARFAGRIRRCPP